MTALSNSAASPTKLPRASRPLRASRTSRSSSQYSHSSSAPVGSPSAVHAHSFMYKRGSDSSPHMCFEASDLAASAHMHTTSHPNIPTHPIYDLLCHHLLCPSHSRVTTFPSRLNTQARRHWDHGTHRQRQSYSTLQSKPEFAVVCANNTKLLTLTNAPPVLCCSICVPGGEGDPLIFS